MAENTMEKTDRFLETLVKESNLTSKQLEAIMFYYDNIDRKIVRNGYVEFKGNKVPKGAFFRTLNQAKNNIRKAVVTLIIMAYLGLIDINQLNIIMQLNNIMMQFKSKEGEVSEELLKAFLERLKNTIDLRKRVK
ncbi:MAG: hypothetical protein QXR97_06600 [Thermoproteota archaeon]